MIELVILSLIPLLVVALGAMFSERSGVTNIGLEGIMIMGAFVGILTTNKLQPYLQSTPQLLWLIGMVVALIVGIIFSSIHAFAAINLKSDQIISATALNIFAPAFSLFLTMSLSLGYQPGTDRLTVSKTLFMIEEVPILSKIPIIGDILFKNVYLSLYVGILILIVSYIVLYKTKLGLRIRACGENPHAADAAGISIYSIRYIGVLTSGALAALGGYILISNIYTEFHSSVAGYGFLALAVMIFGNWKPLRIFFAATFFSFLKVMSDGIAYFPFLEKLNINRYIFDMLPFIATLVILVFMSKSTAAPKSVGLPYFKDKR